MLTDREKAILAFEAEWPGGSKDAAVRARFDVNVVAYTQELHRLLDSPAALAFDPMLVKRLNRLRYKRWIQRRSATRATPAATPGGGAWDTSQ